MYSMHTMYSYVYKCVKSKHAYTTCMNNTLYKPVPWYVLETPEDSCW